MFTASNSLNDATEVINNYILFCEKLDIPEKVVKIYPNSKPWVTKDIRKLLKQKQRALLNNEVEEKRKLQKEIKKHILHSKHQFGDKIKRNFSCGNPKTAWQGMQTITGCGKKQSLCVPGGIDPVDFANNLNQFYARFDVHDFTTAFDATKETLHAI